MQSLADLLPRQPAGAPLPVAGGCARMVLAVGADTLLGAPEVELGDRIGARLREAVGEAGRVEVLDGVPVVTLEVYDALDMAAFARLVARRLLGVIREPYFVPGRGGVRMRPSVGIACAPASATERPQDLREAATGALLVARAATVEPIAIAGDPSFAWAA